MLVNGTRSHYSIKVILFTLIYYLAPKRNKFVENFLFNSTFISHCSNEVIPHILPLLEREETGNTL